MFKDKKKLAVFKNLRKELVILKPDEGNGIALIGTNDYYTTVETCSQIKVNLRKFMTILHQHVYHQSKNT